MAAARTTLGAVNDIMAGRGLVEMGEALTALAGATSLAVFAKKIGLWPKYSATERREVIALDEDMPEGWMRGMQEKVPAATMSGHRVRWRHGTKADNHTGWSFGMSDEGDLLVTTPVLDEDTGKLV